MQFWVETVLDLVMIVMRVGGGCVMFSRLEGGNSFFVVEGEMWWGEIHKLFEGNAIII